MSAPNFKLNTNIRFQIYSSDGVTSLSISLTKQQAVRDAGQASQFTVCGIVKSPAYKGYEIEHKALADSHISYPQIGATVTDSDFVPLVDALNYVFEDEFSTIFDYDNK